MAAISKLSSLSQNQSIDNLLYGYQWGNSIGSGVALTYSFGNLASKYDYTSSDGAILYKTNLTTAQQSAVKSVMSIYSSIINITFKQVSDSGNSYGDIRWNSTKSSMVKTAYAYLPTSNPVAGDIWIGSSYAAYKNPVQGEYGFDTLIHEFGHALGLTHPHEGTTPAVSGEDQIKYSIMSYRSYDGDDTSGYTNSFFPTTPMINDISALQYLYGANKSYHAGNDTYKFAATQKVFQTIWDGGGVDTIDASVMTQAVKIYLTPGKWSEIGSSFWDGEKYVRDCLTIAYNVTIENVKGTVKDDVLEGNSANNILDGFIGKDTMYGLGGNDTYIVDSIYDVVIESESNGTDTIKTSVSYTLPDNVEKIILTGNNPINATGNELNNTLTGNSASNILDGGGGADIMSGGNGNDIYIVDNSDDKIIESANQGVDTVKSSVTYTIGSNIENLTLTGSADIDATGNSLNNIITGNSGNNKLSGGAGNDTYIVDNENSVAYESANQGVDTVKSSVTYTIGSNIENLTLTGSADIDATGNSLNNIITGNSGNNTINGGGGIDKMLGGGGNDTYIVDNVGDTITEGANQGVDSVVSSVTYTIGANIENLTLTGSSAINAVGNSIANAITGNSGKNKISGKLGNDILSGGDGADIFIFDTTLNATTNVDTIMDFETGIDKISLSKSVFTGITGSFTANKFYSGESITSAQTSVNRIFYDESSGAIYYDADGTGTKSAIKFAVLGNSEHPSLAYSDFVIS